jgi:hypothetical protein
MKEVAGPYGGLNHEIEPTVHHLLQRTGPLELCWLQKSNRS